MVEPLGDCCLEADFLVVLVVPTGVRASTCAFNSAVHILVRQLRQRHVKFSAGVAEQPQLLSVGYNDGRIMRKLHVRSLW